MAGIGQSRSRRVSALLTASVDAGASAVRRLDPGSSSVPLIASPTGGLSLAYSHPHGAGISGAEVRLHAGPEFDRLDGSLHRRFQTWADCTVGRTTSTSLRTSVQWAADLRGGPRAERILSFESLLRVPTGERSAAEFSVRGYHQDLRRGPARDVFNDVQLFAGWTTTWRGL
jgi:hypothetical protein